MSLPPLLRVLFFAAAILTSTGQAAEFFVSPAGSDGNSGSRATPFATFARAQTAVRAARKTNPEESVTVRFGAGVYPLEHSLAFTPLDSGPSADHPVTYCAETNATVVISAGRAIDGWQPDPYRPHIWKTRVPAAGDNQSWRFDQLWVNGQAAIRARTPNGRDFSILEGVSEEPMGNDSQRVRHTFTMPAGIRASLGDLGPQELHDVQIVVIHKWDTTREWVDSVSLTNDTLVTRGKKMKFWNKMKRGSLFYLENFIGALDAPGEWFLDRAGWLYYWPRPGEDMAKAEVMAPVLDQLVSVQGRPEAPVQHLRFAGLKFRHAGLEIPTEGFSPNQAAMNTGATAVQLDNSSDIQFTNCAIEHIGPTAI
ncbi:MAG TPA: hypothetical protein VL970_09810, partial [Candidatus Acidoferrales bacterium]|nr:hypothetical protein [Candidatus Acidoferrales bacterium]